MSITSFTDLRAWQEAHKLSLLIYKVVANFPKDEQYALSSQIKRAAISVSSNIAEGFGRTGLKDKIHFFTMASGSLYEVKSQIILAWDLNYLTEEEFRKVEDAINDTHKLLHGLIRAHRNR